MQARRKLKIGEILVQDGLLTQEQVAFVLAQQKARPDVDICPFLACALSRARHPRILERAVTRRNGQ